MNILYIGDIMGEVGIEVVEEVLPRLIQEHKIDLVIAQAENVTSGRGIDHIDYRRLLEAGINFFTGGNHIFNNKQIYPELNDDKAPIIRPLNYPIGTTGKGFKYVDSPGGPVLVVSLLGQIVGKQASQPLDNPLRVIDAVLKSEQGTSKVATIVNFHGDFSSEKVIIGHYLDGKVTAVIGDHWHVPTADAQVLPNGTAHISDVGMCGALDSSLGVTFDSVVPRWRDGVQTRNVLETTGRRQFNGVIVSSNGAGLADSIVHLHIKLQPNKT